MPRKTRKFACAILDCSFITNDAKKLESHVQTHFCQCGDVFVSGSDHNCLYGKGRTADETEVLNPKTVYMKLTASAHNQTFTKYLYAFTENYTLLEEAYDVVEDDLITICKNSLQMFAAIKVQLTFNLTLKEIKTGKFVHRYFHSIYNRIVHANFILSVLEFQLNFIISTLNLYKNETSGYKMKRIDEILFSVAKISFNLPGSFIPTPKKLQKKQGFINIRTTKTDSCFLFSVLSQLYYNLVKLANYPNENYETLNWKARAQVRKLLRNPSTYESIIKQIPETDTTSLTLFHGPVSIPMIDLFETICKISVNVFQYNEKLDKILPIRITEINEEKHVNLLLLEKTCKKSGNTIYHYTSIFNPSRFFAQSDKCKVGRILCKFCATLIRSSNYLKHESECNIKQKLGIEFPSASHFQFKSYGHAMSLPYKMTLELLCCVNKNKNNKIEGCGYGLLGTGWDEKIHFESTYVGEDSMNRLMFDLISCSELLLEKQRKHIIPLLPTIDEIEAKKHKTECELCFQTFKGNEDIHLHHNHYIPDKNIDYFDPHLPNRISYLCARCNMQLKVKTYIPVFMHGCTKSALHLLLEEIKLKLSKPLFVTPSKSNSYTSIYVRNLFKTHSLESFHSEEFNTLFEHYSKIDTYKKYFANLIFAHAGNIYPNLFPHVLSNINFKEITTVPGRNEFYDIIHQRTVLPYEHDQIKQYFKSTLCANLYDYAKKYLSFRIHAIAAIVQSLNYWTLQNFKLSIHHEVSLASIAYNSAMLKCNENYEYLKDIEITKLVTDNLIAGISHMSLRHMKAKSERLGDVNVLDQERSEILFADIQSQYAHSLADFLPIGEYKLIKNDDANSFDVNGVAEDAEYSYLVCCDLDYPDNIKRQTEDFPYVVERKIKTDTECNSNLAEGKAETFIVLTQETKRNVLLHIRSLQYFLSKGMSLQKIHYLIMFRQKRFLKPFIEQTIEMKKESKTKIERQLAKNFANFLYGKFYAGNKHLQVKFCEDQSRFSNLAAKNGFKDAEILRENLSMVLMAKTKMLYDKNILVPFVVLELSRLHLWKLIDILREKFKNRMYIGAIEVDSITAYILDPQKSFVADMKSLGSIFDFSTLPKQCELYSTENDGHAGKFRLEYPYCKEFIKLRSKLYSLKNVCKSCFVSSGENDECPECINSGESGNTYVVKGGFEKTKDIFKKYLDFIDQESDIHKEISLVKRDGKDICLSRSQRRIKKSIDCSRVWNSDLITSKPYGALP